VVKLPQPNQVYYLLMNLILFHYDNGNEINLFLELDDYLEWFLFCHMMDKKSSSYLSLIRGIGGMGWDVTKDGKWGWLAISDRTIWHFDVLQSLIEKKKI